MLGNPIEQIGGMLGLGGGATGAEKQHRNMLMNYYDVVAGRQSPYMDNTQTGKMSSFRQNQSDLVSRLEALSQGKGPSLADAQMRAAMDKSQSQQASLANSGRGGPMMALQAANNMARQGAQTTQDAGAARIAEQQMALNQLGLTLHGARGYDESMSKFNASQLNNTGLANLDARLRTMGMNDQARLGILSQFGTSATNEANRPSATEQLLAGGAGMLGQYMGMRGGGGGQGGPAPMGYSGGGTMNPYASGYPSYRPPGSGLGSGSDMPWY